MDRDTAFDKLCCATKRTGKPDREGDEALVIPDLIRNPRGGVDGRVTVPDLPSGYPGRRADI